MAVTEARRRALDKYAAKKRAETARKTWPCTQCGDPIKWDTKGGGNRRKICLTCAPNDRFRALVRRYGVNKVMFDAMYSEQDGKCAIPSCTREARSVDHDHETGKVRGLLCQGCNVAIGFLESERWTKEATTYLRKHLAQQLTG